PKMIYSAYIIFSLAVFRQKNIFRIRSLTIFNPQDAIISGICAIVILVCFGLMAANMIEALIESYIVISAGVIMMGFGGSHWTNDYAKKLLIYAVSVGAKLFLIQLMVGLCERLISQLASEFNGANLNDGHLTPPIHAQSEPVGRVSRRQIQQRYHDSGHRLPNSTRDLARGLARPGR
ncbi:MAG: hypothetical protein EBU88_12280, partial [Acidobacteria bacterium]|nr:hypothetical protein [Acidobacteriota bacterium]